MKINRLFRILIAAALAVSMVLACCGCRQEAPAAGGAAGDAEGLYLTPDGYYHVDTVENLLRAIRPGASILLEPGLYDMSEYMVKAYGAADFKVDGVEYVELRQCADGVELVIKNVPDLSIEGGTYICGDTELTIDPRHGTVLTFEGCSNLTLSDMTLGHADLGDCSGDVIDLVRCADVRLFNMDLYGCGAVGLDIGSGTENVFVYNTVIHDCSEGALSIYGCTGDIIFSRCIFTGSAGGGWYDPTDTSSLTFDRCAFGEEETATWLYEDGFEAVDCVWAMFNPFSDWDGEWDDGWGYEPPLFDVEQFDEFPAYKDFMDGSAWIGYEAVAIGTGETTYYDYMSEEPDERVCAEFREDGGGYLELPGERLEFEWSADEEEGVITMQADGQTLYGRLYTIDTEESYGFWLSIQYNERLIWLY